MECVKHIYSNRVYVVKRDHGPNSPYVYSPPDYVSRYLKPSELSRFFVPCDEPPQWERKRDITIPQEHEWEKIQDIKNKVPEAKTTKPKTSNKREPRCRGRKITRDRGNSHKSEGSLELADICGELSLAPAKARKLLRSQGEKKPPQGWKWSNPQEFERIKKILKKHL